MTETPQEPIPNDTDPELVEPETTTNDLTEQPDADLAVDQAPVPDVPDEGDESQ